MTPLVYLDSSGGGDAFGGFLVLAGLVILYFLPTIIASHRHNLNAGAVFVIDLFLGWTLLGWVIALAMAVSGATKPASTPNQP